MRLVVRTPKTTSVVNPHMPSMSRNTPSTSAKTSTALRELVIIDLPHGLSAISTSSSGHCEINAFIKKNAADRETGCYFDRAEMQIDSDAPAVRAEDLSVCVHPRPRVKPGEELFRARGQPGLVIFVAGFARELRERGVGVDHTGDFAEPDLRVHRDDELVHQIARMWPNDGRTQDFVGAFPFVPPGGAPVGQFPVTNGNRSGNLAISANAIDALLFGVPGASAVAPGIFGLSGVFTDPQFQVVIRALNQKKGVDLLSAPRVTTKSGQRAVIEIVREFRYPTQFEPPQIPQTVGSTAGLAAGAATIPITPTTPTAFETRNTGVTLEVEPVVGPDGITIDLNLVPQVVEFEGFINYGSPILAPPSAILSALGTVVPGLSQSERVLTPNIINQPIFSSRKVTTSVSVWDGQTVVLGGLMREDVQKTEDRTPIIGDIPIVGRLFRTNAEQHLKRNLVIFVTARLINPGGQLVNQTEEEEETEDLIQPPELPPVPMYKK